MVGKYPIVTLCGSTRLKNEFMDAQKRLTLEGKKYYHRNLWIQD